MPASWGVGLQQEPEEMVTMAPFFLSTIPGNTMWTMRLAAAMFHVDDVPERVLRDLREVLRIGVEHTPVIHQDANVSVLQGFPDHVVNLAAAAEESATMMSVSPLCRCQLCLCDICSFSWISGWSGRCWAHGWPAPLHRPLIPSVAPTGQASKGANSFHGATLKMDFKYPRSGFNQRIHTRNKLASVSNQSSTRWKL